jgi:phage major head subunit gpT-like protein
MGLYTPHLDSRDIVADFFPEFEQNYAGSWARLISWINPDSVLETENYKWLGGAPQMRQWVGGRHEETLGKYSYSLANVTYETSLPISVDDLRRDKTGQLRVKIGELAMEAGRHDEELITTLLTANGLAYDGKDFFDTDHAESGTNQLNLLTATEVPAANVATATAPTPAEAAQVLLQTIAYMYSYTNDKGKSINGTAREFQIMVGTVALYSAFLQAIALNNLANGTVPNNPLIALNEVRFNVIFNSGLAAVTDKIYVFRSDGKLRPFIVQYETPLEQQLQGEGSYEEFKNNRHLFGLKWVKAAGYGMWQHATRVTLS